MSTPNEPEADDGSASAHGAIAQDDHYTVTRNSGATVLTPSIYANDTETPFPIYSASDPANGTYNPNTREYTPDPGYQGIDTFTYDFFYTTDTGLATSNTATVTIRVTAGSEGMVAVNDAFTVDAGSSTSLPVGNNDTGLFADSEARIRAQPGHGTTVTDSGAQSFTYTPAQGFSGTDTFSYEQFWHDGLGGSYHSNIATVTITVRGSAGVLTANDDTYTVQQDSEQNVFTVQSNDSNPAAANLETPSDPPHGTVTTRDGPNQAYLYTPDPGFHGTDTFTYRYHYLADTTQQSNTATVTITVSPTGGGGGSGGEDNTVSVRANCSGNVTFTNLISEEINVRYGPGDSLEGEFDLPAGQSQTITTNAKVLNYLAANETSGEQGSIEIPNCSNDDGDGGDGDGDGDDDEEGDDDNGGGKLPDTGGTMSARLLFLAMLSSIGGLLFIARTRRIA